MNVVLKQDRRAGVLTTPLGTDQLVLSRFDGSEGVSELFEWRIEALSNDGDLDFDALLGKNATLTIHGTAGGTRHFDGIVTETQWLGVRDHFHCYRLVLRPWLWVLSHRTDCFIFHEKTVPQIIAEVFARHGALADFEDRTSASYPPLEYCVQYRESDMSFVTRLMEEYGISYFFTHEEGAHRLVMTDGNAQFDAVPRGSRPYLPLAGQDRRTEECLHHFIPERRFASGKATFRDYNFKSPSAQMEAEQAGTGAYEHADKELYDYPGRYEKQGQGKILSRIRMESEEALDRRCLASGNCVTLFPGGTMSLTGHPFASYNKEYVLLRCQHSFISQQYRSGAGSIGEDSYEGQYEMIDSAIPIRPQRVTPKPMVHGPQTAIVVGKDGEEIDCDEYGRILVRFFWDRKNDQSMRCRVAQNWASKQWGGMIIPRIGMEVMVEHLEGDPDRPIVTGCVYNGENMPPYTLPRFKTRSTFKSDSHKGNGYNELRFEDEKDAEEVFLHAQKYLNAIVLDDETWDVGGNRDFKIAKSQSQRIGQDKDMTVGGDHREQVGASRSETIGANYARSVGSNESVTIGSNQSVAIGGNMSQSIAGNTRFEIGGKAHLSTDSSQYFDAGTDIVIDAGTTICLKVGGNYIKIGPAGIEIEGTMVRVNCGGSPSQGSTVSKTEPDAPKKVAGPHAERYGRSSEK